MEVLVKAADDRKPRTEAMEAGASKNDRFALTKPLTALLAIAAGLAIGNLYWAQPLLVQISGSLGVEVADTGLLITATQIGYAAGILLIVPLGDICPRRKLITVVMALAACSLLACATAPSFLFLAFGLSALGVTTVSGQIIIPLARDLADPKEQGQAVGILAAGVMLGILAARTLSGLVADFLGWRSIYLIATVTNLVLAGVLFKALPKMPAKEKTPYPKLIADVFKSIVRYKPLKWILITNGIVFGVVFNLFWTSLTFLLAAEPFGYNTFQIGLVSIAGITGAVASFGVGKLQDKGYGVQATGAFIGVSLLSMALAFFAGESLALVVVAAAVYSLGVQGVGILNQARAMALDPARSSRLNTIFVFNNFVCGAIGSAASGFIWAWAGWLGICAAAVMVILIALVCWRIGSRAS
ncbi:MFS transporter [Eggerthellaceae bacterium zg-886]|uniref:MFS transporter n=2 Tax=Xiamenia xianingshaonis TaxID=2682776 RepID=A0ABX0IJH8_9ACTN|nr:MFS transporter [Xiamenia xianingshaonis]